MDEETAAVSFKYASRPFRTAWSEAALSDALDHLEHTNPSSYDELMSAPEAYGMAVELNVHPSGLGENGYDTGLHFKPTVDDHVIEEADEDLNEEVCEKLASLWAEEIVARISESMEATSLSAKEFATAMTMGDDYCSEAEAADALGITIGTYRGKKGRIEDKHKACEETRIYRRLAGVDAERSSGYAKRDRSFDSVRNQPNRVTSTEVLTERLVTRNRLQQNIEETWLEYARDPVQTRKHDTYEQIQWQTAHIEGVDSVFVADTTELDGEDVIRLDFDGIGEHDADLHRPRENIQVSTWFDEEAALHLYKNLQSKLRSTGVLEE